MKKLLRKRDYLLLGLAGVVDLYNDLKDPLGIMGKIYEGSQYRWLPNLYRKTNYYGAVHYALKTGDIEKIIKNGQVYIRLSDKGLKNIHRDFPISRFQNQKWDRKWRIVIFDIEEKERKNRDYLRIKLKEVGFGMIQESVWISPYDVALDFREFINSNGLGSRVFVMEANKLLAGDPKKLSARIWRLEELNRKYKQLLSKLKIYNDRYNNSTIQGTGGMEKKKGEGEMIRQEYLEILKKDPCLPKELLPENWFGEETKDLLKKL